MVEWFYKHWMSKMAVVLSVYLPSDGVGMKKDEMCNILLQEQSF